MTPLASIIVPCHNSAPWLAASLESALDQVPGRQEIIVVDDGSTDDSAAVARRYEARGVRLVRQDNRGASAARNHGLALARGAHVQFLDSDDLLGAGKIRLQLERLGAAGPGHLASGEWARFTGDPAGASFEPYPNYRDMSGVEFQQVFYEQTAMMQPGAWLAPRELLDRAGPWDERLSLNDDGEYFARVMLAARGILFVPGARLYYRSGLAGSLSRARGRRHCESAFLATESIAARLLQADGSPRTRAALAWAWKWLAFDLYPHAPDLVRRAQANCLALGGCPRPYPAGPAYQVLAKLLGWRLAKRLRQLLTPLRQ